MKSCSCFGHRKIEVDKRLENRIEREIEQLIKKGNDKFSEIKFTKKGRSTTCLFKFFIKLDNSYFNNAVNGFNVRKRRFRNFFFNV